MPDGVSVEITPKALAVSQLKLRRRRWLMSAQGWSASDNPGDHHVKRHLNPEKGSPIAEPFSGFMALLIVNLGFSQARTLG